VGVGGSVRIGRSSTGTDIQIADNYVSGKHVQVDLVRDLQSGALKIRVENLSTRNTVEFRQRPNISVTLPSPEERTDARANLLQSGIVVPEIYAVLAALLVYARTRRSGEDEIQLFQGWFDPAVLIEVRRILGPLRDDPESLGWLVGPEGLGTAEARAAYHERMSARLNLVEGQAAELQDVDLRFLHDEELRKWGERLASLLEELAPMGSLPGWEEAQLREINALTRALSDLSAQARAENSFRTLARWPNVEQMRMVMALAVIGQGGDFAAAAQELNSGKRPRITPQAARNYFSSVAQTFLQLSPGRIQAAPLTGDQLRDLAAIANQVQVGDRVEVRAEGVPPVQAVVTKLENGQVTYQADSGETGTVPGRSVRLLNPISAGAEERPLDRRNRIVLGEILDRYPAPGGVLTLFLQPDGQIKNPSYTEAVVHLKVEKGEENAHRIAVLNPAQAPQPFLGFLARNGNRLSLDPGRLEGESVPNWSNRTALNDLLKPGETFSVFVDAERGRVRIPGGALVRLSVGEAQDGLRPITVLSDPQGVPANFMEFVKRNNAALGTSAGAEEIQRLDREAFLQRYSEQGHLVPAKTNLLMVVPEGSVVTLYRPGTLANEVAELVETQRKELPVHLKIEPQDIPADAAGVKVPSLVVWDKALGEMSYAPPVPVIEHWKGQPFEKNLLQMIAAALAGRLDAVQVQLQAVWGFEREGRSYTVFAVQA